MVLIAYNDIERDTGRLGALNSSALQPLKTQAIPISQRRLPNSNDATPLQLLPQSARPAYWPEALNLGWLSYSLPVLPFQSFQPFQPFQQSHAPQSRTHTHDLCCIPIPPAQHTQTTAEQHLMNRVYCICLLRPLVQATELCLCCSFSFSVPQSPNSFISLLLFSLCVEENLSR